jgi:hypothetical protein
MTNTRKRSCKTRLLLLGLASLTVASAIAQDVQNVKEVPEADVTIAPAVVDEPVSIFSVLHDYALNESRPASGRTTCTTSRSCIRRHVQSSNHIVISLTRVHLANRAFKQAVSTLHSITVAAAAAAEASPASSLLHSVPRTASTTPSLVWSFLPTAHGYGPLSSAIRIYQRIRSYPWLPASLSSRLAEGGRETRKARRRDEDLRGKAVKAIDLLQHAAALGHTDALYLLAKTYFYTALLREPSWGFRGVPGTCGHHRKCDLSGNAGLLPHDWVPRRDPERRSEGTTLLYVWCPWGRSRCSIGTCISELGWHWNTAELQPCYGVVFCGS